MIRVLHVMRSLDAGGIGTFIMNIYRAVDRNQIQFDFAITHDGMGLYGSEIEKLGGNIYFISKNGNRNIFDGFIQLINLCRLCKKQKYDVIHTHYYFANAYYLLVGKLTGIRKRVSHCHNTRTKNVSLLRRIFEKVSQRLLLSVGTDFLGCSQAAAIFLYGTNAVKNGKAEVLYNGIDYAYWDIDSIDIKSVKDKFHICTDNVIIFVGRLTKQKNPIYALQTVKQLRKFRNDFIFIMIGTGDYKDSVLEYINKNQMSTYVQLLPPDSDVRALQSISKVMLAPSLWEGLSIAFIEAQKLYTVVVASNMIPQEVDMGLCRFYSLSDNEKWVNEISSILDGKKQRCQFNDNFFEFDVCVTKTKLLNIYLRKK